MRWRALALLGAIGFGSFAWAATARPLVVTTQHHSFAEADDCAGFYTESLTSLPSKALAEEQRRVEINGINVLRIKTENEGGVSVRGWDRPYARLTICKCALASTDVQAKRVLEGIVVGVHPGEITTSGPGPDGTQAWWAHMILRVPRTANIDVTSVNGGIAIRNMSGNVTARADNGGISLASCTGETYIKTENGGISIDKVSGRVDAVTQNGAISLKLRDDAIPSLEARTEDPGEILCNLKGCAGTLGTWTADRKHLRIGSSHPAIRLFTNTAPIMIEQVR